MKRTISLALIPFSIVPLVAQTAPKITGTINGVPISDKALNIERSTAVAHFFAKQHREPTSPADQQQVDAYWHDMRCERLKFAIEGGMKQAVTEQLGIAVTKEDLEAAQKAYPLLSDPNMPAQAAAMLTAISAVLDKHQDPDQVYDQIIKPYLSKQEWELCLHNVSTPESRQSYTKKLAGQMSQTPEVVKKQAANIENWRFIAEFRKMRQAVDRQLASSDPTFASYLKIYGNGRFVPNDPRFAYLAQKRTAFWNAQFAKINLYVSDPTLVSSCDLSGVGIEIASQ